MNREIKFRIWDIENKEMLKVQELDFEPTFYGGRIAIRPDQYNDYFDTEDMILMQYTGIDDKNGKEIYEGDIVRFYERYNKIEIIGAVRYNKACQFVVDFVFTEKENHWKTGKKKGFAINNKCEVIGNDKENNYLLK